MQRVLSVLVSITWGLWFGGLVTLFIAVQALFAVFGPQQRAIAGFGAAAIFHRFELFQLILAATALVVTLLWRMTGGRCRLKVMILALFSLATCCAIVETAYFSRNIDRLRGMAKTDTPEFRKLHGMSMAVYLGETVLVFAAGLLLPAAIGRASGRATSTIDLRQVDPSSGPARPGPSGVVIG